MDANPPFAVVTGQRQLAVIMFTDAVSFSARMNEQEVATLHRIERDFETMRRAISAHAGTVLKSTGDGLLVQFASAVQAVSCALEIQQGFSSRGAGIATGAVSLRHRIAIHLGDVFASEGDLMGDGVNIAARLVAEASPGGIVISQMVHDVVKKKLPLHVVHLGPRQLKGIKEPVSVFRVLLEAPAVASAAHTRPPMEPVPAAPPSSRKPFFVFLGLLVAAAAAWALWRAQSAHEEELKESQSAQAALGELLKNRTASPVEKTGNERNAPQLARTDFAAAVTATPGRDRTGSDAESLRREAEAAVLPLIAWLKTRLGTYHANRPLVAQRLGDANFTGATLYSGAAGELYFVGDGAWRRREWSDLNDATKAGVIVAAMRDAASVPAEVRHGAEAFAYLHGRPEMIAALK